ncbi:MAG: NUDIX domain-containing protein, partial [Flavobacteriaceae bacterium]
RVLARLYGIATPINSSEGQKSFSKLAQDLLDKKNPDTNNQAIMEFGARHCKPKQPLCEACVFVTHCVAYQTGKVSELPVKQKKIKLKTRYFNYIVCISNSGQTLLNKRTEKGIWANLYEFPLIETDALADYDELYSAIEQSSFSVNTFELLPYNIDSIVHKLSHQHIYTRFWILKTNEYLKAGIPVSDITKYPVPVLIANFIKAYFF